MLEAGKVIACTAIEAMENPNILEMAKAELSERLVGMTYQSLIPEHVNPPGKVKQSYRAI
jgi:aminobenzoyl-glutamate utilization protein B